MKAKSYLIILMLVLSFLTPGCTQKSLREQLQDNQEYWQYLGGQGVRDLDYAKMVTIIYTAIADNLGQNPVDTMTLWREEIQGESPSQFTENLKEKGLTQQEASLITGALTSFDSEWNEYMRFTIIVDDYVDARLGYSGIPRRKANVSVDLMKVKGAEQVVDLDNPEVKPKGSGGH